MKFLILCVGLATAGCATNQRGANACSMLDRPELSSEYKQCLSGRGIALR